MARQRPSTPQDSASERVFFVLIGLAVMFLVPLGTLYLSFQLATILGFVAEALVFTCLGGFLLGTAFPTLAINYLACGKYSVLSKLHERFLQEELTLQHSLDAENIKQLRKAYDELKTKYEAIQLEEVKPQHELGSWRE